MVTEAGSPRRPPLTQGATSAAFCCPPPLKAMVGRWLLIKRSASADACEGQKQASDDGRRGTGECIDRRWAGQGGPCGPAGRAG